MHKDMLADFLHLFHGFGALASELPGLLERFDNNPRRLRKAEPGELAKWGFRRKLIERLEIQSEREVARDLCWAETAGNHLICFDDEAYPALLRQTSGFPALLYASGEAALLSQPQVSIVGSRRCTPGGAQTAFDFASQLAGAGLAITSGLALGIDAAAHRGALQAGGGTLAVLGSGIDILYPAANRGLAGEIRQRGLILSEFPPGTAPRQANFPRRNRIISGLSMATLVVEAAERSGSLITARLAAEQGREVFAVPGSIHNPLSRGCHCLIRDGAILADEPRRVTRELGNLLGFVTAELSAAPRKRHCDLDPEHRRLLESIGYDPVSCDILVQRSGLTIDKLSSMLLVLELKDLIHSAPDGCFVRI